MLHIPARIKRVKTKEGERTCCVSSGYRLNISWRSGSEGVRWLMMKKLMVSTP